MSHAKAKPAVPAADIPPDDVMDPEIAYYDLAIWPARKERADEVRRAYAVYLAMDAALVPEKIIPLAADIDAYLRDGRVPGRGGENVSQVFVTAMDEQGNTLR